MWMFYLIVIWLHFIFQRSTAPALRAPCQITWPTACSLVGRESLVLWWCWNAQQGTIWVWDIGLFAALPMGPGRGQMTQLHARVSIDTNMNTIMTTLCKKNHNCYCQIYFAQNHLTPSPLNKLIKLHYDIMFCALVHLPRHLEWHITLFMNLHWLYHHIHI